MYKKGASSATRTSFPGRKSHLDPLFETEKRCPDCREHKPLEEFPRKRNSKDGRHAYCKPCHNARGYETRQRLYGGSRRYHLTRRYGISAAEVERLIAEQGGICAICRVKPAAHVDHNHQTGQVRGILCFGCNGGLGQFQDNTEWMGRAILYVQADGSVHGQQDPAIIPQS